MGLLDGRVEEKIFKGENILIEIFKTKKENKG